MKLIKAELLKNLIKPLIFICILMQFSIFCNADMGNRSLHIWSWHGGKYWKNNGLDKTYRIENKFNGQAIVLSDGQVITRQFQGAVPEYQQRIMFEAVDENNGYYRLYVDNGEKRHYLTAMPDQKGVQYVELQEIKVYDSSGKSLISAKSSGVLSSVYYDNPLYGAEKALDGDENTFASTNAESHPYFELDLGEESLDISKITISIRGFLRTRLKGASVIIKDGQNKEVWRDTLKIPAPVYKLGLDKAVRGRYIRIEHNFENDKSIYVHGTNKPHGDKSIWRITQVSPTGFYKLLNKAIGKVIQAPMHLSLDVLQDSMHPIKLVDFKRGDSTMCWSIEPVCDFAVDILAVSEIGWVPEAPQKWAYLVRKAKLKDLPMWKVVDVVSGKELLSGGAIYAGFMYQLHYYLIDLTSFKQTGDYLLECDGDGANVHIADNAYRDFRHRGGSDVTHLSDMLDGKGFIGYWAHNDKWDHVEYLTQPYFVIRDFKTNKDIVTKEKITAKYLGGWDHTDRWTSAIQPISEVLRQLVFAHDICEDKELSVHIVNEMLYGIEYLVDIQNEDGSWPFATFCSNKTTGTTAAVAGALAQAYPFIADESLAEKTLNAVKSGWEWVKSHPDAWADLKDMTYRHGWAEEKMMLALEVSFLMDSADARGIAFEMIKDSKIMLKNGAWVKKEGKFKGQSMNNRGTLQALISMMRHYNQMPEDIRKVILTQWEEYYNLLMQWHEKYHGPFYHWEIQTGGYGPNSRWVRNANFLYRIYKINPEKFQKGFYIAEHVLDWIFGVNPFATSLVHGFGDRFLSESWIRPYIKGSILPGLAVYLKDGKWIPPVELTPSLQGYGNGESETSLGVVLMQCLLQREQLRNIYPPASLPPTGSVVKK